MNEEMKLKKAINILMERTLGYLEIGMYIEPDNYCIKFLDHNKQVVDWFCISEKEYNLLREVFYNEWFRF